MGKLVILPKIRDPRFITLRRGGSLQDHDHRLLAIWAAACAEHVLNHFEQARPTDDRPRRAIDLGRAWARDETLRAARAAAPEGEREAAGRLERLWQRAQLPSEIRELVLDDQRLRNELCWFAFDS
jgi:hypothetical protein